MKKIIYVLIALILVASTLTACKNEEEAWAEQIAQYRAAKMDSYETENAKYSDYEVDVAFLGDSLTDGYDLAAYYPQYLVANRGIGGETSIGLEERLKVSVYDLKPKVAVMLIGANNPDTMMENYESILKGFVENLPNTKIILLSLTSMGGSDWGKNNQLAAYNNVQIKMLAEKYSFEYVDIYSPLLNLEDGEIYDEYTTDGGHLTPLGYEVLTQKITPVIEKQMAAWAIENEQ